MMRRCELPARDLCLLDPLFVYPYTILHMEHAIIVNLEQIRFVLAADEVLLLYSVDIYVFQYAVELHRRLLQRADGDELPFEFRALEPALEAASSFLDAQGFPLQRYGNGAGGEGMAGEACRRAEQRRQLQQHLSSGGSRAILTSCGCSCSSLIVSPAPGH